MSVEATEDLALTAGGSLRERVGRTALDGEHIGLNDDPVPQPFPWPSVASDG